MNHLLDTHTLLWALTDPDRLGKLPSADVLVRGYPRHLDRLGVAGLSITEEHALLAGQLDWEHRDPFDRILAAQAMTESLTLITADAVFDSLPGVATAW